jgi:hypothetical protein
MPENGEASGKQKMVHQRISTSAGLAIASAFFMLTACQPPASTATNIPSISTETAAAPTSANECSATVEKLWGPIGPSDHPSNRIKVWTSGVDCQTAVATLAIYARDGYPIYAWAGATQFLFGLKDAKTVQEMNTALQDWLGPDNQPPDMTGTLPPWEETDGQTKPSEFPFMPREGMDQASYEELRKQNLHKLCYPQGQESLLCLALYPGPMIDEIGIQRFPG